MNYCSKCGAAMPDKAGFCGACGGEITHNNAEARVNTGKQNTGFGMKFKIIVGVVLAVLLLTGGFLGWSNFSSEANLEKKLDLAVKYLSENKYDEAILAYNEAIKIDPKNMEARVGLAQAYIGKGDYVQAEKAVKNAKEIGSLSPEQYQKLIKAYMDKEKIPEADKLLGEAQGKYEGNSILADTDKLLTQEKARAEGMLTLDYWIPDINRTYVYTHNQESDTYGQYTRQMFVNWTRQTDKSYLKSRKYFVNDDTSREICSLDSYLLKGNSVHWMSTSVEEYLHKEQVVSGENEIITQVKPGQSWSNNYVVSEGGSERHTSETCCFIGFSNLTYLGDTHQVAHIQKNGSTIFYQGTKNINSNHYVVDYWYAKGIGVIKWSESLHWTDYDELITEELTSVE